MAHSALSQVPVTVSFNSDTSLPKTVFKGNNVSFKEKPWISRLSLDFRTAKAHSKGKPVICMSVQQASKDKAAISPLSLEDAKEPPLHLYKNEEPYTATVVSVEKLVGPKAPGETCHIVIDHGGNVPYWEGQSYGIIPPGENPCLLIRSSHC